MLVAVEAELLIQTVALAPASPVSMHRVATTPWSDEPRDRQDPSSDAAKRDRPSMPRIRSNVVIRCILHHVRNLSLRDPTVGVIDEQMLAVVLAPNRVAPCTSTSGTCGAASSVRRARWRCSSFPRPSRQSRTGLRDPRHRGSRASAASWRGLPREATLAWPRLVSPPCPHYWTRYPSIHKFRQIETAPIRSMNRERD